MLLLGHAKVKCDSSNATAALADATSPDHHASMSSRRAHSHACMGNNQTSWGEAAGSRQQRPSQLHPSRASCAFFASSVHHPSHPAACHLPLPHPHPAVAAAAAAEQAAASAAAPSSRPTHVVRLHHMPYKGEASDLLHSVRHSSTRHSPHGDRPW